MKTIEPTNLEDAHHPAWKALGDIELTPGEFIEVRLTSWIDLILGPLNLPSDFTAGLIKEALRVTRRALVNAPAPADHIHLTIYVPNREIPDGKSWGFFHTARKAADHRMAGSGSHLIDYYLFMEGN